MFLCLFSKGQLSGGDGVSYDFNMASLAEHLKKQSEQGASTYYNIDIIKYEVRTCYCYRKEKKEGNPWIDFVMVMASGIAREHMSMTAMESLREEGGHTS